MNTAKLVRSDPPMLACNEVAVVTSHKETGVWDAADIERFLARHPGTITEQEAEAALARVGRSLGQLGDEAPAEGAERAASLAGGEEET